MLQDRQKTKMPNGFR